MWRLDDALVQRIYRRASAERWQLPTAAFTRFLLASAQCAFGEEPPDSQKLGRYFESLHLQDLALACACAEGDERAWDAFILEYRPSLYRAADALDPSGGSRELADSLYAELFGLKSLNGERQSQLRYFHGRSSLRTWLRAVLSQRYIDRRRLDSRVEPLPDDDVAASATSSAQSSAASAFPRPALLRFIDLLGRVIAAVVATQPPRDRLRLRCYYGRT